MRKLKIPLLIIIGLILGVSISKIRYDFSSQSYIANASTDTYSIPSPMEEDTQTILALAYTNIEDIISITETETETKTETEQTLIIKEVTEDINEESIDTNEKSTDVNDETSSIDDETASINNKTEEDNETYNLLFIGDSRFVGMKEVNTEGYTFYCKTGKGYAWYNSNIDDINTLIKEDTIIIFGLGVNDLYNISKYKTLENSKYFNQTYFLSVNPVDELNEANHGYTIKNDDIDNFNLQMQQIFEDRFIDTNHYLSENGFDAPDGVHYTKDTYRTIYNFIIDYLYPKG